MKAQFEKLLLLSSMTHGNLPKQAVGKGWVGSVLYFQSRSVPTALKAKPGREVIVGSAGPASTSKIFHQGSRSASLLAITGPATPAPTIMKSNLKPTKNSLHDKTLKYYL